MVAQPIEIEIDPESETGKLLAQADERPLRLVSAGQRFRIESDAEEAGDQATEDAASPDDLFAGIDRERAAAVWRASFGVWKDMDTEALKAELKEQRRQDSIGRPGW